MISPKKRRWLTDKERHTILTLVGKGLPYKEIAARVGWTVHTVDNVVRARRQEKADKAAAAHSPLKREAWEYVRCGGCGGMQLMPCAVCAARKRSGAGCYKKGIDYGGQ